MHNGTFFGWRLLSSCVQLSFLAWHNASENLHHRGYWGNRIQLLPLSLLQPWPAWCWKGDQMENEHLERLQNISSHKDVLITLSHVIIHHQDKFSIQKSFASNFSWNIVPPTLMPRGPQMQNKSLENFLGIKSINRIGLALLELIWATC